MLNTEGYSQPSDLYKKIKKKSFLIVQRSKLILCLLYRVPTKTEKPGKFKISWKSHRNVMEHANLTKRHGILYASYY